MINYYDTQNEINLIKSRLVILKQKKELLKSLVEPKLKVSDEINVQTTHESDKNLVEYTHRKFLIDKEIALKSQELVFLGSKLKEMENYLRQTKGLKQKVFVLRHIEGLSVRKIADKLRFSQWNIYKILKKIERELSSLN